jgi:hypothetical protein
VGPRPVEIGHQRHPDPLHAGGHQMVLDAQRCWATGAPHSASGSSPNSTSPAMIPSGTRHAAGGRRRCSWPRPGTSRDCGRRRRAPRARPSTARRPPGARRLRSRAPAAAQLPEMERLPGRRAAGAVVPPVAVPPERARLGHDDQHLAGPAQLLDVGLAGPAVIGVAAAVQQVEHRPVVAAVALLPTVGGQQPHLGGPAQRRGLDGQVDQVGAGLLLRDDGGAIAGRSGGARRSRAQQDGEQGQRGK